MEFEYIEKAGDLAGVLKAVKQETEIGLDLEFDNNSFTYGVNLCLVQISTRSKRVYLIDPIRISDLKGVLELFEDKRIRKVIHSGSEDVFVINSLGASIQNILDTEKLSKLAGEEKQGLSDLTHKYFGVKKSKDLQRSNWNIRPIKSELLKYAAEDVEHLLDLSDIMIDRVNIKGLKDWIVPLMRMFENEYNSERVEKGLWVKGMNELSDEQKVRALILLTIREEFAKKNDIPPYRILKNPLVLLLAKRKWKDYKAWKSFKGLSETSKSEEFFNRYNSSLLDPNFVNKVEDRLSSKNNKQFVKPHIFQKRIKILEGLKSALVKTAGEDASRLVLSKSKINEIAVSGNIQRIDPFFIEICSSKDFNPKDEFLELS